MSDGGSASGANYFLVGTYLLQKRVREPTALKETKP